MGRSPFCDQMGLKKGPWTPEEDQKLQAYIQEHGHGTWRALPPKAGLQRCGKSCRLRWTNYLRPDIKRGEFSLQEQKTIIHLHALLGNKWSVIASHLPKRTDNEIKNYWNTHLKKRLIRMGIDPSTHRPKSQALGSARPKDIANLNHMAQWETARLEAEARIIPTLRSPLANKSASGPPPIRPPPCLDILKVWQATNNGRRVILPLRGGFSGTHQLESPTSTLCLTPNGVAHEGSIKLAEVNCAEPSKGIMGNSSMHIMPRCFSDSSIFFEDVTKTTTGLSDDAVFMEDNYTFNQWSNILNVVGSPTYSSIF